MQYMLLIYDDEQLWERMSESERKAILDEYFQFSASIRESGNYVGSNALQPTGTATSVRVRGGETLVTDGPFAETKEQLGGYYLVEATDVDQAIQLAARIPSARFGTVEVRPVMVFTEGATA